MSHAYPGENFEISLKPGGVFILTPTEKPRTGWTAAFNSTTKINEEEPLIDELENDFDKDEWQW